jgi:MscS family membrane protein
MMVDQALDNLTQRRFRRAKFNISLTYDTPAAALQAICEDIRMAIASNDLTKSEPAQVRFAEFGESSLNIMIVFFVEAVDWSEYNRIREEINYKIMQVVCAHQATFAFPTRTLHVVNEPVNSLYNSRN